MKTNEQKFKIDHFSREMIKKTDSIIGGNGKVGDIDRDKPGQIPTRGR